MHRLMRSTSLSMMKRRSRWSMNDKPFNRVTADAWEANKVFFQKCSKQHASVASAVAASKRCSRLSMNDMTISALQAVSCEKIGLDRVFIDHEI